MEGAAASGPPPGDTGGVYAHLVSMKLLDTPASEYATALIADGYDTPEAVDELSLDELRDDFGLKKGHLRAVERFRAGDAMPSDLPDAIIEAMAGTPAASPAKPLGQPPSMAAPLSAAAAAEAALQQQEAPPAEEAKSTAVKLVSAIPECVLVCGKNGSGELGVPGGSKIKVPAVVAALAEHKVVDACANTAGLGGSGTCGFVTSEGSVFCCGKNTKLNVLGTGQAGKKVTEPTLSDCAGASGFLLFSNGNVALSIVGTALHRRGDGGGLWAARTREGLRPM
jgi:hypothetical protein